MTRVATFLSRVRLLPAWGRLLAGAALVLAVLFLVILFFPWDWLRGPVNRYVSDRTGRQFEITRRLDVKLGRRITVMADGITFANPDWARDPYLVKADSAEFDLLFWPLLRGQIELPRVRLTQPVLGLQIQPDGRRTWALGKDTSDAATVPLVGQLLVDKGVLNYLAEAQGADIKAEFGMVAANGAEAGTAAADGDMPLSYKAQGTWKKEPFAAKGRAGSVLQLSDTQVNPFPLEINASAGRTSLLASGRIGNLASLDGLDANFDLKGRTLADLYNL
ncbi:AsmA family protein, partial [Polaromonas sp.]|uniref:AsmA family protein n=1 Tax=Polaromonas sp. TaxID=1869339 RepID=UPI002488FA79